MNGWMERFHFVIVLFLLLLPLVSSCDDRHHHHPLQFQVDGIITFSCKYSYQKRPTSSSRMDGLVAAAVSVSVPAYVTALPQSRKVKGENWPTDGPNPVIYLSIVSPFRFKQAALKYRPTASPYRTSADICTRAR